LSSTPFTCSNWTGGGSFSFLPNLIFVSFLLFKVHRIDEMSHVYLDVFDDGCQGIVFESRIEIDGSPKEIGGGVCYKKLELCGNFSSEFSYHCGITIWSK
jgi:hypothetical protein